MTVSNGSDMKIDVKPEPSAPTLDYHEPGTVGANAGIVRRWKMEDLLKRGSLWLRGIALFFSLISFILIVSNNHGDWREFDKYEEYRYLLAIAILSILYTGGQVFRQAHELSTGKNLLQLRTVALIDFVGDQWFSLHQCCSSWCWFGKNSESFGFVRDTLCQMMCHCVDLKNLHGIKKQIT
ncbi:CASP-like protein 4B1 isoform X1 [Gastrolobium bilobum]|uniref:CASP-like protein 4B1 isoform X1 n=1 Tax=Gastrolobium bilobum TaxID=150636 RepID=UPI002AB02D6A|nr:CASP-like protein 4B1 isoform X1 [Gastrolobium bilobum]